MTYDLEPGDERLELTGVIHKCTRCMYWQDIEAFGLRRMGDGVIRVQAQCGECRSKDPDHPDQMSLL